MCVCVSCAYINVDSWALSLLGKFLQTLSVKGGSVIKMLFTRAEKNSRLALGTAVHGLDSRFQPVSLLVNKTTGEETHHMIKSAALLDS